MGAVSDVMTPDEFKLFRDLIHNECGIFLKEEKRDFLKMRVEKRLKTLSIGSYFNYYRYVKDERNRRELSSLLDSITINETYFFRNTPQFEILREKVIPELIERKRKAGDYNLMAWSAGCATGEEAYSIAIEILEAIPDISRWNVQVIASDISWRCIEIGQSGVYSGEKLKDVPPGYLTKYFIYSGDIYQVMDNVKRLVIFDFHNLKHENGLTKVDVVFCRNVMIYFDIEEQKRIVARFRKVLNKDGYLFLGHAESLQGIANGDFRFLYLNKGTAYQKVKATDE